MLARFTFLFSLLFTLTSAAEMICISENQARLRELPSTNSRMLRVVYENTPLRIISKKNRWLEVKDYSGRQFFVFDSLIVKNRECLIILGGARTYRDNLYEAAPHPKRSTLHHLEGLRVIKKDLDFIKVQDRFGHQFWIAAESRFWPKAL